MMDWTLLEDWLVSWGISQGKYPHWLNCYTPVVIHWLIYEVVDVSSVVWPGVHPSTDVIT